MHVGVIHTIKDRARWDDATSQLDLSALPSGMTLISTVTAQDVSRAVCIWVAPSVDQVQSMLDELLGTTAVNECFAADPARSMGVPQPEGAAAQA